MNKKLKLKPLYDRVVIKREQEEERSPGGIFIPDTAKEKPIFGTVMAVGSGKVLENGTKQAPIVKVGDKVLFGKYAGTEVKHEDDDYLIMREDDLMAIVE